MKKYRFLITLSLAVVLAAICFFALPTEAKATAEYTDGDYTYIVENGEATIIGYTGPGGDITIPDTLGGYPVWSICHPAFTDCDSLTRVRIPASVRGMESGVFSSCTNLESITVDANNPNYCDNFGVLFNKDMTVLRQYPCAKAGVYWIPAGVEELSYGAFSYCRLLTGVVIPASVTRIEEVCFWECEKLEDVWVDEENLVYSDLNGVLFTKDKTGLIFVSSNLESYTVPNRVRVIERYAFNSCNALSSVIIPDSVAYINFRAFYNCTKLKKLYYGGTAEQWKKIQFENNNEPLLNATLRFENVAEAGFCGENVRWTLGHEGTLTISGTGPMWDYGIGQALAPSPFHDRSGEINAVIIENGVTAIGTFAFYECGNITSITIPASVTEIGDSAFENCSSLISVVIPDGVTKINMNTFAGCSALSSVTIPDSVTKIGKFAFLACKSLESITIPNGITEIEAEVFEGCSALTSVIIPDSVTAIGGFAFADCSSLVSIKIPDSVTIIEYAAFMGCTGLAEINIPESVRYIGADVFVGTNLNFNIHENAQYLGNKNNPYHALITTIRKDIASCSIHKDTKVLAGSAFSCCTNLTEIVIPDGVLSIGELCFEMCENLAAATIPNSLRKIGWSSFYYSYAFEDIYYIGTAEQWAEVDIDENNKYLNEATLHFQPLNGWIQENGKWYFYEDGAKKIGWLNTNGVWYYMDAAGVMQTGWKQINGYWYFFESNGVMATNAWKKDSKGWCYLGANGAMRTNAWVQDTKGWCYVDASGYCLTNQWAKDSKGWIWLDSEGSMTKSKWIQYNGLWYYLDAEGYMATGWQKVNNTWYYLGANGVMATGWQKVNNVWYYLGTNGAMQTGWVQLGNVWYYLHDSGVMATGTVKIGAKTYTFASNGVWIP